MKYKKELISVIVPVYNVEKYLNRCMDSIIENTYKNLEIICINDGSTDDSLNILKKYKELDSRVILIDKANGGLSSARNRGLELATGEYIAFIDSDDWIHPKYFEYLLRAISENDADMSLCNYMITKGNDVLKEIKYSQEYVSVNTPIDDNFSMKSYVWRRLFRHSNIENLFFDEHVKIEDADYLVRLLVKHPDIKIADIYCFICVLP